MELSWRRYGLSISAMRAQVGETSRRVAKRVDRRHSPDQHLEIQREYLQASGTRYVSPIR